jgi:hypothetical protein
LNMVMNWASLQIFFEAGRGLLCIFASYGALSDIGK